MSSRKDVSDAQQLVRKNKKACLLNLCETIHKRVEENNGRMPHKFMKTLVEENQKSFDWLSRDMINSAYTRYKKRKRMKENTQKDQPTIFHIQIENNNTGTSTTSRNTSISDLTVVFDHHEDEVSNNIIDTPENDFVEDDSNSINVTMI